jgi:hypothetical protein
MLLQLARNAGNGGFRSSNASDKLKGRVGPDRKLKITEDSAELPEGDVEVILLYQQDHPNYKREIPSPLTWPALDGRYQHADL